MENYNLKEDEVVLYKGTVSSKKFDGHTQLLLTNHNLVFIVEKRKMFQEATVSVESYCVGDIKIYEGKPQVKIANSLVEVYLKTAEVEMSFESKIEQHKFLSAVNTLLTGKTDAERSAEKVKEVIGLVNDTLDVDIVKSTGDVVKNGLVGSITGTFGKIGKTLFGKNKK